jgi:hypothetical protein
MAKKKSLHLPGTLPGRPSKWSKDQSGANVSYQNHTETFFRSDPPPQSSLIWLPRKPALQKFGYTGKRNNAG